MILERMANMNVFHKVRQLEVLSKNTLVMSASRSSQIGSTTNFVGIQRCLNTNVSNNTNSRILTKVPPSPILTAYQSRASSTHGDHVRLWVMEKLVSVALPVMLPAALIVEHPVTDSLLAFLVVMHTHWGLEAIIVDYARPIVVGKMVQQVALWSLTALSAITLAGLLMLTFYGPGIAKAVKNGWAIGKGDNKSA